MKTTSRAQRKREANIKRKAVKNLFYDEMRKAINQRAVEYNCSEQLSAITHIREFHVFIEAACSVGPEIAHIIRSTAPEVKKELEEHYELTQST